jgi:AhpC/TSA family
MNLRTFLPLPEVPTAEPPAVGDAAPELPDAGRDRPAVLAFLRHPGCPFAEQTARSLRAAAAAQPGVTWVAVSHAPAEATAEWERAVGGLGDVEMVVDAQRRLYGAWGVARTDLAHFMGPRALRSVFRLAREGVRNRHPHGSRWQSAGTFGVDAAATVRWRHLPAHAGDLPDLVGAGRTVTA